jgi:hypothetical protein
MKKYPLLMDIRVVLIFPGRELRCTKIFAHLSRFLWLRDLEIEFLGENSVHLWVLEAITKLSARRLSRFSF